MFKTNWVASPEVPYAAKHEYKRISENKWVLYVDKIEQKTIYTDVQLLSYLSHGAKFIDEPEWAKPVLWPRLFIRKDALVVVFENLKGKCINFTNGTVEDYNCFLSKTQSEIDRLGYRELHKEARMKFLNLFTQ